MRAQVIEELEKLDGVTHVFALTFNIDLAFVEHWLLPALRHCGHPSLTIIADGACANDSFARQRGTARRLGKRYRIAPVPPLSAAAFHPKAILAASETRATLFVGSGNISFGGLKDNAEVWARYDSDRGGGGEIAAFRAYLDEGVARLVDPEPIRREITDAMDPATRRWARELGAPSGLVGRMGTGPSLLHRAHELFGDAPIDELIVAAPYFDREGAALRELVARTRPKSVRLLVPAIGSSLTKRAHDDLDKSWIVQSTRVQRGVQQQRAAFIHAKWYAFVRDESALVFLGSANASRAAWTLEGSSGNAELLAVRRMRLDQLRTDFLEELTIDDTPIQLLEEDDVEDVVLPQAPAVIAVARHLHDRLRITWQSASPTAEVSAVRVDGEKAQWRAVGLRSIEVEWPLEVTHVSLSIVLGASGLVEVEAWVDHEQELATSARARRTVDLVEEYGRNGEGDLREWLALVEPFEAELREAAAMAASDDHAARTERNRDEVIEYDWADVFPDDEPDTSRVAASLSAGRTGRGRAAEMRALLLRALGALLPEEEDDQGDQSTDIDPDEEETPAKRRGRKEEDRKSATPSAGALTRAERTVRRAVDALISPKLLEHRPAASLQRDITLLATLLRIARKEEWIGDSIFTQLSARALTTLLSAGARKGSTPLGVGWLEERRRLDPEQPFVEQIRSTALVATLCAWLGDALTAAANDQERAVIEHVGLAAFSSVRWLFERTRAANFSGELARCVAIGSAGDPADAWQRARHAWRRWDRSGRALLRLQAVLRTKRAVEWRKLTNLDGAVRGDLVYTGNRLLGRVVRVTSAPPRVSVIPVTGAAQMTFDGAYVVRVDASLLSALGPEAVRWMREADATLARLSLPD